MSQHFLLSSSARSLGLMDIMTMTEDDAWLIMREARWSDTDGDPVCPRCGSEAAYTIRTRHQFRCKACGRTFSVTSGTIFEDRKLPLRLYLAAILIFSNAAKGLSALQLSRDLNVHYRTAYRLLQTLRESLYDSRDERPMKGIIEVDGAYVGHYIRPANRKEDRVDRRSAELPNKRCVMVMRQRGERGADRTMIEVVGSETSEIAIEFVTGGAIGGTVVHADEAPAYDCLAAWFETRRVNHSVEYSGPNGENVNQAESFFSRFRRLERGQVHHLSPGYLGLYSNEIAYREDTRRWSNGEIFVDLLGKAFAVPLPDRWRNYGRRQDTCRVAMAA